MDSPLKDHRTPLERLPRNPGSVIRGASKLYGFLSALNGGFMNLLPNIRTRVPLISVGNLEVGGTGKTPILAKLASMLNGLGYQPGLLTGLGEGGSSGILNLGDAILDTESPDEAQMLARRFPDLAVIAARPKWKGAKTLDAQRVCDVILLDDGFQHQRLARDIDLVLISGSVPLTSNQVLPAGPLREFPSALKRADAFLLPELVDLPEELPDRPVFRFRTLNTGLFELGGEKAETSGRPFMVISAIARPGRFEDASSHWGEIALRLRFRDHAPWSIEIRDSIAEAMEEYPDCQPLLTEKDAARWGASWDLPGPPPLYLDLQIDWEDPQALLDWLDSRLKSC